MYNFISKVSNFLNPELAHSLFINYLKFNRIKKKVDNKILNVELLGKKFSNPLGIAAGFDKNAESIKGILNLGFGFAEVGTVTLLPQLGNKKPRVFKIPEMQAVIQSLGFNNLGIDNFLKNLAKFKKNKINGIVGVNIGKNKDSDDYLDDYLKLLKKCSELADYLVVNISSPNTPGLRDIQKKEKIYFFLKTLSANNVKNIPLLLKISPDISTNDLENICHISLTENFLNGLIVSNTTVSRHGLKKMCENNLWKKSEPGGLSGPPLFDLSNKILKKTYLLTRGKIPIIGVGGISSADDAFQKISLGASLIQIYTSLIYKGPNIIIEILDGLEKILKKNGFKNINSAVGCKVKLK